MNIEFWVVTELMPVFLLRFWKIQKEIEIHINRYQ